MLFATHSRMLKGDQPMKKVSRESAKMETGIAKPELTVGLDMGDLCGKAICVQEKRARARL